MASSGQSGRPRSQSWEERLQEHCQRARLPSPVFNIVSDRRGGRTAWSSTVTIQSSLPNSPQQRTIQARYWYDGQYVHNAREDAAEVALLHLTGNTTPASPPGYSNGPAQSAAQPNSPSASSSAGYTGGYGNAQAPQGGMWPRSPPASASQSNGNWGSLGR